MLPSKPPRQTPRPIDEITRLIEMYPPEYRRWCSAPERGGCACMGCVRHPAHSTVRGDPEYRAWPNPDDALSHAEVELYLQKRDEENANLFAAAHDLYAALELYEATCASTQTNPTPTQENRVILAARAALAKARGGAP